jgi:hypothetical protein
MILRRLDPESKYMMNYWLGIAGQESFINNPNKSPRAATLHIHVMVIANIYLRRVNLPASQ